MKKFLLYTLLVSSFNLFSDVALSAPRTEFTNNNIVANIFVQDQVSHTLLRYPNSTNTPWQFYPKPSSSYYSVYCGMRSGFNNTVINADDASTNLILVGTFGCSGIQQLNGCGGGYHPHLFCPTQDKFNIQPIYHSSLDNSGLASIKATYNIVDEQNHYLGDCILNATIADNYYTVNSYNYYYYYVVSNGTTCKGPYKAILEGGTLRSSKDSQTEFVNYIFNIQAK